MIIQIQTVNITTVINGHIEVDLFSLRIRLHNKNLLTMRKFRQVFHQ